MNPFYGQKCLPQEVVGQAAEGFEEKAVSKV